MSISQYSSVYANRFSSSDRLLSASFYRFANRSLFTLLTLSIGTPRLIQHSFIFECLPIRRRVSSKRAEPPPSQARHCRHRRRRLVHAEPKANSR